MKKYLFIALAALGFAACAEKDDHNLSVNNGEKEQSYIAVTFSADDLGTRAPGDDYDEGTADEREVKCAHFFFFDGNDSPFLINDTNNWLRVGTEDIENGLFGEDNTGNGKPNVSDVKTIMAIKNYKGEYPSQIVAVLNLGGGLAATYTLDDLSKELVNIKGADDAFVMSNSVYAEESQKLEINATVLTPANIGKSPEEAKQNAVTIHVERLAAKVVVKAAGDGNTVRNDAYEVGEVDGEKVYAEILSWDFYNEFEDSRLIKDIDTNWTSGDLGFPWNDEAWYRSYWAETPNRAFPADNMVSYNDLNNNLEVKPYYCGENTLANKADKTQVVLKAQFVKAGGSNLEVATWWAHSYLGENNLLTAVANSLANQIYYMDGSEYKSITAGDLKVVEAKETNPNTDAEVEAYHVFFQLSTAGEAKDWYLYSAADGFQYKDDNKINIVLGGVEPALLYKNGRAYYYTNIRHLGATKDKVGYDGVVRNHSYVVNITKIEGFGTPVYNPDTKFVPETPEDFTTYVAADVRILSWRLVDHNYEL